MPDPPPTILLLAGEASGDHHGARVARALRRRWPEARLLGLGGEAMDAQGVELLAELDDLAVMGFGEVLSRLPFFWRLERRLKRLLDREVVDLVLPIDYPGLNLRIARAARKRDIPVLYYIAPQVWAWRRRRARQLARDADHVAVILPFEVPIFREAGADVTFVGHPLLERDEEVPDRRTFHEELALDPDRPILAIFPGSRKQELDRHLELFLEAGQRVRRKRPDVQLVLARATSVPRAALEDLDLPVTPHSRALLRHARAALVKSGTTTLEAALEATPFVVAYRTSRLTYFLARRLVRVDHVALANLVAGRRLVPELIQDDATPGALASAVEPFLEEGKERAAVVGGLRSVRESLGTPGAAERVAAIAGELIEEEGPPS